MGLLERYLAREILLPFGAGLLFLTQLLLATTLLSQSDMLFGSGVALADVALIAAAMVPYFVGLVLPIAFLMGCILGVGRLAEDREVVALSAAGISPARLVRVPLLLGVVVAAIAGVLYLHVEPLTLRAARLRMNDVVKRNVMNDVRPGTFYDQIPGYTLYAERAEAGRWENVLIHDQSSAGAPVLALARSGRLEPVGQGGDMQLALGDGEVHRDEASEGEYAVAGFRAAELVVGLGTALSDRNSIGRSSREQLVPDYLRLAAEARARGDLRGARRLEGFLHRKFSSALVVIPFALLAVPFGAWRRGGRAFGVLATVGVIIAHYLLLRTAEVQVQAGNLGAAWGMQLPNVALAAAGAALIGLLVRRGAGAVR